VTEVVGVAGLLELAAGVDEPVIGWKLDRWKGLEVAAVYRTGDGAPERLGWAAFEPAERGAAEAGLRQAGLAVGDYDDNTGFLWTSDAGLVVWGDDGRVLHTEGTLLHWRHGRTIDRTDIARVTAYVADDHVDRGVRVELRGGAAHDVLFDLSTAAGALIGYSRNDLLFDSGWAVQVGAAVAGWAGVPFEDRI